MFLAQHHPPSLASAHSGARHARDSRRCRAHYADSIAVVNSAAAATTTTSATALGSRRITAALLRHSTWTGPIAPTGPRARALAPPTDPPVAESFVSISQRQRRCTHHRTQRRVDIISGVPPARRPSSAPDASGRAPEFHSTAPRREVERAERLCARERVSCGRIVCVCARGTSGAESRSGETFTNMSTFEPPPRASERRYLWPQCPRARAPADPRKVHAREFTVSVRNMPATQYQPQNSTWRTQSSNTL